MSFRGAEAYKTSNISTADPATLVSMLFDGALKAVRKARLYQENRNREAFFGETERASLILGELLTALDMDQGEIPRLLSGLYAYCMRLLAECSIDDPANLDEVERHVSRIAESWKASVAALRSEAPATARGDGARA